MSQFAHGISTLDLTATSTPIWLLGSHYPPDDAYLSAFHSILWFTYRRDFAQMAPYEYTTDAGWGCMLRSAQMMLGCALQRQMLGRRWRVPVCTTEALPSSYTTLLSWFVDAPASTCRYSLHNMVDVGFHYDQLPGEWYGPTTAAQVLRDLVNGHAREGLAMYVPQEGVVYSDDVDKLVVSYSEETTATDAFFDPLLNVPTTVHSPWHRALLVLIPLRLGLDRLNECYIPAVQQSFAFPQSIGIIGGKKGHSVYFVGTQAHQLHLLDPHAVHPSAELNALFPTATHLSTLHAPAPLVMNIDSIDPSMALGFLCTCREEYLDFCERVGHLQATLGAMACPFAVADRRPDYGASQVEMEMEEARLDSTSDEEEEYVLI